jgi:hypothetical protein
MSRDFLVFESSNRFLELRGSVILLKLISWSKVVFEELIVVQLFKKSPTFIAVEVSLPLSQESVSGFSPEQAESTPRHHIA